MALLCVLKKKKKDNNHSIYFTSPVFQKAAWTSLLQRAEMESESVNTWCSGPPRCPGPLLLISKQQAKQQNHGVLHLVALFSGSAAKQVKYFNLRLLSLCFSRPDLNSLLSTFLNIILSLSFLMGHIHVSQERPMNQACLIFIWELA